MSRKTVSQFSYGEKHFWNYAKDKNHFNTKGGRFMVKKHYDFASGEKILENRMLLSDMTESYHERTIGRKIPFVEVEVNERLVSYYDSTLHNSSKKRLVEC